MGASQLQQSWPSIPVLKKPLTFSMHHLGIWLGDLCRERAFQQCSFSTGSAVCSRIVQKLQSAYL